MAELLKVEGLVSGYGEARVVANVSFSLNNGKSLALLGRNGVGKTTLIRSIIGFTPPRRGTIRFAGESIERLPSYAIARRGVGLVPQGRRIFASLTVRENLTIGAVGRAPGPWTLERVYTMFPRLRERSGNFGGQLSGGEQQMLAIGRALMANPVLLLMDEPSEGLAPIIVRELTETLGQLKATGLAIVLVEQNLPLALAVADTASIVSKGRVVFHGAPERIRHDEEVRTTYLGV